MCSLRAHQRAATIAPRSGSTTTFLPRGSPPKKRTLAHLARVRPAFSIIWINSMRRSCIMALSTSISCSVVREGTSLRRRGASSVCSLSSQAGDAVAFHALHLLNSGVSVFPNI